MEWCIIGLWVISALAVMDMYKRKGYGYGWGAVVGFLLGPIGILVAATKGDKAST